MVSTIDLKGVDHTGIRVKDADRALTFYEVLGFEVITRIDFDPVIIIRNPVGVEINLIVNAAQEDDGSNVLMDIDTKHAGITHVAFRVSSIPNTMKVLRDSNIAITQGPVMFGEDGHVSLFVRDPDFNVIELRGRAENLDEIEGLEKYENVN